MDDPDYLIVNPIQIEIILTDYTTEKITEIEKRFNDKMERLRNISMENKRVKNMSHEVILVDV